MFYQISIERENSDFYFCQKSINTSNFPHVHSHIEFVFVLNGKLSLDIDKNHYTLKENEMVVIMPYEIHQYTFIEHVETFVIACPPDYISEYRTIFKKKVFEYPIAVFDDSSKELMNDIVNGDYTDNFKKKAILYCALSHLTAQCSLVEKKSLEYDLYRKAIIYISQNYTKNLSLNAVARQLGVSTAHLSRILNQKSGSKFTDIVNTLKIYKAKKMLEETSLSISEIAFETGYGSIRNFNRIFKKYFNCNPRDIRNI